MSTFQPTYSSFQPHNSLFADRELERRIATFLTTRADVTVKYLSVRATAGRVFIRGVVAQEGRKRRIEAYIRRVAGVLAVTNEIRVRTRKSTAKPRRRAQSRHFWLTESQPASTYEIVSRQMSFN